MPAQRPAKTGWNKLRPAVSRASAQELIEARRAIGPNAPVSAAPHTGAQEKIYAEAPDIAREPDIPTGAIPVVAARSSLAERGVGQRVRSYTSVSTGFIPLVRDAASEPKSPTLSALNQQTQERKEQNAAQEAQRQQEALEALMQAREEAKASSSRWKTETTHGALANENQLENLNLAQISTPEAQERAEARAEAVRDRPRFLRLRSFIIGAAVPILTLMIAIRAIASSAFLWLEYRRPGFPADDYGMDLNERMRLGSYGLDYVTNLAPRTYLVGISDTDGHQAFTPAEVAHMHDVKRVLFVATVFAVLVLVLALLSSMSLRYRAPGTIRRSLFAGAWSTLGIILVGGVVGLLSWEWLFENFHKLFFPQGNWQFSYRDTLIRLYPPQFWVDAAITILVIVLLICALVLACTWPTRARVQLADMRRQERIDLSRRLKSAESDKASEEASEGLETEAALPDLAEGEIVPEAPLVVSGPGVKND